MRGFLTQGRLSVLIIFVVLLVDQIIKIAVKTGMCLYESIRVCGNWFYIFFTENPGMAFGMELFSKWFLSAFRIVAVVCIGYFLYKVIQKKSQTGYVICLSLVWAGAMGNIIDSVFYGLIFSPSFPATFWNQEPAHFVAFGEGYATWFHGKVVDMFYFPIIETTWPQWIPFVGGQEFTFFSPIFNFADAAISCGIIALLIFYRKELDQSLSLIFRKKEKEPEEQQP